MTNPALQSKLLKLAEFNKLHYRDTSPYAEAGKTGARIEGAREENARLRPVLLALIECVEAIQEHVECEPGMYGNECVSLGGADGLRLALARIEALVKDVTE